MIDLLALLFVISLPGLIAGAIFAIPFVYTDKQTKGMLEDYDSNSYLTAHME